MDVDAWAEFCHIVIIGFFGDELTPRSCKTTGVQQFIDVLGEHVGL